jgi:dipeptidyl aminopeptidase/acylaminoacyl peptidase
LTFSEDGGAIAALGADGLRLWEVPPGKELRHLALGPPGGGAAILTGARALAWTGPEGRVVLLDAASGKEFLRLPRTAGAVRIAQAPDGKVLAVGDIEGALWLFEAATGRQLHRLEAHRGPVGPLAFSPDGRTLASGSRDGTTLIWDVTRPPPVEPRMRPADSVGPDVLWAALDGADAEEAFRVMGALVSRPANAAALLGERLRPIAAADGERVARLLADLDSADFAVRQAAEGELRALGRSVAVVLGKAQATNPSPEVRRRLAGLLEELQGGAVPSLPLRTLRSLEVLDHLGTGEAERILRGLAGGMPEARLTIEAKAALR